MSGNDTLLLLGSLSTNDLAALNTVTNVCTTILTTEKAKIVDVITVLRLDAQILVLTSAGNQHKVKAWLEKFIIMEDVDVRDVTAEYSVYSVHGTRTLKRLSPEVPSPIAQDTYYCDEKQGYYLFANTMWKTPVFTLVSPKMRGTRFEDEARQVDPSFMEILRVENGIPIYGKELTEDINPLEAGLSQYISFSKGCYIGQEVIARIDTYGRLHKKLVGLVFSELDETLLNAGTLYSSGNEVGYTTSHVWAPTFSKYVALGYLSIVADTEQNMFKHEQMADPIAVRVSPLPFGQPLG